MKLLSEAMRWAADSSAFWEQPMCVYIIHKGTATPWHVGFTVRDFLLSFNNLKSRNSQPCPNDLVMKRSWVHTNTAEEVPGKPCTGGVCVQWMVCVCAQWMVLVHSKVQHQAEASASPGSAQSGIAWTPGSRKTVALKRSSLDFKTLLFPSYMTYKWPAAPMLLPPSSFTNEPDPPCLGNAVWANKAVLWQS